LSHFLALSEIALMRMRIDHIASRIVNANHGICERL